MTMNNTYEPSDVVSLLAHALVGGLPSWDSTIVVELKLPIRIFVSVRECWTSLSIERTDRPSEPLAGMVDIGHLTTSGDEGMATILLGALTHLVMYPELDDRERAIAFVISAVASNGLAPGESLSAPHLARLARCTPATARRAIAVLCRWGVLVGQGSRQPAVIGAGSGPYLRALATLRHDVRSADWTPHRLLPSRTKIAEMYGVSTVGAGRLLDQLVRDGLAYPVPKGFRRADRHHDPLDGHAGALAVRTSLLERGTPASGLVRHVEGLGSGAVNMTLAGLVIEVTAVLEHVNGLGTMIHLDGGRTMPGRMLGERVSFGGVANDWLVDMATADAVVDCVLEAVLDTFPAVDVVRSIVELDERVRAAGGEYWYAADVPVSNHLTRKVVGALVADELVARVGRDRCGIRYAATPAWRRQWA